MGKLDGEKMNFQPVNRHMLIEPIEIAETAESQVLLPEDYKPSDERYKLCKVVKVAADCTEQVAPNILAIVNASMIEEIRVLDNRFFLVLENHIMGVVGD